MDQFVSLEMSGIYSDSNVIKNGLDIQYRVFEFYWKWFRHEHIRELLEQFLSSFNIEKNILTPSELDSRLGRFESNIITGEMWHEVNTYNNFTGTYKTLAELISNALSDSYYLIDKAYPHSLVVVLISLMYELLVLISKGDNNKQINQCVNEIIEADKLQTDIKQIMDRFNIDAETKHNVLGLGYVATNMAAIKEKARTATNCIKGNSSIENMKTIINETINTIKSPNNNNPHSLKSVILQGKKILIANVNIYYALANSMKVNIIRPTNNNAKFNYLTLLDTTTHIKTINDTNNEQLGDIDRHNISNYSKDNMLTKENNIYEKENLKNLKISARNSLKLFLEGTGTPISDKFTHLLVELRKSESEGEMLIKKVSL